MIRVPASAKQIIKKQMIDTENVKTKEIDDLPVPERQYPATPAGVASFNAWWSDMLPEERAYLESLAHSDEVDKRHHR